MLTAKAITFDIDWAPDFMIRECMDICAEGGVRASFYATHPTPILAEIDADPRFELGIHPNFLPGSSHGKTYDEVMSYCMALAPRATSMRTHSLYQDSRMFAHITHAFPQIKVDASLFLMGHPNLQRVDLHLGEGKSIHRLPFYWEDDSFAEMPQSDWAKAPVTTTGLNIFAFHPVHVALNTSRMTTYETMRAKRPSIQSWTQEFTAEYVNQAKGARTFLRDLIARVPKAEFMTITEMGHAA